MLQVTVIANAAAIQFSEGGKIIVKKKIFCIEKQMEYHKYILSSDVFDESEKK
jgi:hypothetical protein